MMKPSRDLELYVQLLANLNQLPKKIVQMHDHHGNTPEFILYELCSPTCFNLKRAAYFVDNPDFDCLKGVAGICRREQEINQSKDIWQDPDTYVICMQRSPFNQHVRNIVQTSFHRKGIKEKELTGVLADSLEMDQPEICCWHMKHANHGILIFERDETSCPWNEEDLENGASLLGFCPIC